MQHIIVSHASSGRFIEVVEKQYVLSDCVTYYTNLTVGLSFLIVETLLAQKWKINDNNQLNHIVGPAIFQLVAMHFKSSLRPLNGTQSKKN